MVTELSVFDFDDTLFVSDSKVKIKKKSGKIKYLNSSEFASYKPKKHDEFDFTDFDRIQGKFVQWTKKRFDDSVRASNCLTVIITARGRTDNLEEFFSNLGYKKDDIIFIGTGSADPKTKIDEMRALVNKFTPDEVIYYENCSKVFQEFIDDNGPVKSTTSFYLIDTSSKNCDYQLFVKGKNVGKSK